LGPLRYFLDIEVVRSSLGIEINQCKYGLNILTEIDMFDCRLIDTHMDLNIKLLPGHGEPLKDPIRYKRLKDRIDYLIIRRPDIFFDVSIVSQFFSALCDSHYWDTFIRIIIYINNAPGRGLLYENNDDVKITCYSYVD
jgi:hypothetical protein